jgi:hypothetical protein
MASSSVGGNTGTNSGGAGKGGVASSGSNNAGAGAGGVAAGGSSVGGAGTGGVQRVVPKRAAAA